MATLSLNNFKDVTISVPWGHISGLWYGNRQERPILALHGWQENLGSFDRLIPLMPDYLGVLCIDLPGHGQSSRLPPGIQYDFVDWAFVIVRIMKELKWSKVSLMGHSLGGILSFIHTSLAPDTVDLVITIEGVLNPLGRLEDLSTSAFHIDKYLEEDERTVQPNMYEPSSHTMNHLCNLLSAATLESVPTNLAPHLLNRSIYRSQLYPDKFYLFKDNRIKYCNDFLMTPELGVEMARRIGQKPYLIIKGSQSHHITELDNELIAILRNQNPHFELHEGSGLHHLHLCNPIECAKYIVPFLNRHRPPLTKQPEYSPRQLHKL